MMAKVIICRNTFYNIAISWSVAKNTTIQTLRYDASKESIPKLCGGFYKPIVEKKCLNNNYLCVYKYEVFDSQKGSL